MTSDEAVEARVTSPGHSADEGERNQRCALLFAAWPDRIEEYARSIAALLPEHARGAEVRAGLVEALGNAIIHGALGVSYEGRAAGDIEASLDAIDRASAALAGCASVRVEIKTDSAGTAIVITDPGPGFDWRASPSSGGLGLTIMRSVFCAIHWNAEGNVVSLGLAPPST